MYLHPEGGGTAGSNAPGAFLVFFFGGHLPQTSGFRSAKQILVLSFATQARAFILSDRNISYTPGGGTTAGSNAPGAFLVISLIDFQVCFMLLCVSLLKLFFVVSFLCVIRIRCLVYFDIFYALVCCLMLVS